MRYQRHRRWCRVFCPTANLWLPQCVRANFLSLSAASSRNCGEPSGRISNLTRTVAITLGNDQTLLIIGHGDAVWKGRTLGHNFRAFRSACQGSLAILVRVSATLYQEDSFVRLQRGESWIEFLLPSVEPSRDSWRTRSRHSVLHQAATGRTLKRRVNSTRGRDRCKRRGRGIPIGHRGRRNHKIHARLVKVERVPLKHPLGFEAGTC